MPDVLHEADPVTPEERAAKVLSSNVSEYKECEPCRWYHELSFLDPPSYHEPCADICEMCEDHHLDHVFADAIRAAVAEEREACAQTVDRHRFSVVAEWGLIGLVLMKCREAHAAAIRARAAP